MAPASPSVHHLFTPILAALLLGSLPAHAQAPYLTALSPVRNAITAPRTGNVALTFSQPISAATAGNVRIFSHQRGGQLNRPGSGTLSGGGTSNLTFDPLTDFRPGESVYTTVPGTVQGTGGQAAARQVFQLTTAVGGTGTGSFVAPAINPDPSVGVMPSCVAAGDIDADGDLDLLTANYDNGNGSTASVRFNNGSGSFSGTQEVSVDAGPYSVTVGDVDGDGDLDLLTANFNQGTGNTVSVRLNDGMGFFSGARSVPVADGPHGVVLGDVDADGDLDLLSACSFAQAVSVRLNDGTGTFSGTHDVSVGRNPESVTVGDVDADGDLDLATASFNTSTVSVRLNDGMGTFSGTLEVSVGYGPQYVALGDVDADGDLDLLSANSGDNSISVRLNDGNGLFSGTHDVSVRTFPICVVVGDIDADGDLDLVATSFDAGAGRLSVRFNNGTGTFSGTTSIAVGVFPQSIVLADVDGDGDLDLLNTNADDHNVSVRLNGGTGPTGITPGTEPSAFRVFPNPVDAGTRLRATGSGADLPLTLLDSMGRRIATLQADAAGTATLLTDDLSPGLYLLRTADGRTARLVVE